MINNNPCENCSHIYVCSKRQILSKFDNENKSYIGVDITIDRCLDLLEDKDGEED